jgi:hypothetical protein
MGRVILRKGPGVLTATDFESDSDVEILDATAHLVTDVQGRLPQARGEPQVQSAVTRWPTAMPTAICRSVTSQSTRFTRRSDTNYHVERARVGLKHRH